MIDRVARALAEAAHRIDPTVFEECAVSLLAESIAGLSPIPGGTDHGRDAQVIRPGAKPIQVAITSSRTQKGARANVLRSIRSLRTHGVEGDEVIAVNLAELNQTQRRSLETMVDREGYKLIAIYDRSYFAARLATQGLWRQRLLGLPGGAYSFAPVSDPARPALERDSLVGRDNEVSEIERSTRDLIVWGVAGAGKTSVLEGLEGLVFLQGSPSDERLLDDLLDASPAIVVVDDAGARSEVLSRLRVARSAEGLGFRIIGVCWPHERSVVATYLPAADQIEIGLLTRSQIAEVVHARGIRNRMVVQRILAQAMGRVGWATHLADLLKDESTRRSVFDGVALQSEVERFVIRAGLPSTTSSLLAILGLAGRIADAELLQLAAKLQLQRLDLSAQLVQLATGGLIEVGEQTSYEGEPSKTFEVVPELLALSLAGTIFTKAMAAASANELALWLPNARKEIIGRTIKCALMGVDAARIPARAFMRGVLETPTPPPAVELLQNYSLLGEREAREVLEFLLERASAVEDSLRGPFSQRTARTDLLDVLEYMADYELGEYATETLLDQLRACEADGIEFVKPLTSAVDALRGFAQHDRADTQALTTFGVRAISWYRASPNAASQAVLAHAMTQVLKPSFDATALSVTQHRAIEFRSGCLDRGQIEQMLADVWVPYSELGLIHSTEETRELCDLIGEWAQVARGYAVGHGAIPAPAIQNAARVAVKTMSKTVIPALQDSPGLRARLRHDLRSIVSVPESDPFLRAVFDTRDPSENWRSWQAKRERSILDNAPTDLSAPREWCALLRTLKFEMTHTRQLRWVDAVVVLLREKVDWTEATEWIQAIVDHELVDEARGPIADGLSLGAIPRQLLDTLLENERLRELVVVHGIRAGSNDPYADHALRSARPDDAALIEIEVLRGDASDDFLLALLETEDTQLRVATAAAIVSGTRDEASVSEHLVAPVTEALKLLKLPLPHRLHFDGTFITSLKDFAPHVYRLKLTEAVVSYRRDHEWRALHEFGESPSTMTRTERREFWAALPTDVQGSRIFGLLAGDDMDWMHEMLRDHQVNAETVLTAVGNTDGVSVADLAKLVMPYGVDPLRVAATIEYGTGWGEEHERLARHLEYLTGLADSSDPDLRRVGIEGVKYFQPRHEAAARKAHRAEVTGAF
jgi:hypothetical protein